MSTPEDLERLILAAVESSDIPDTRTWAPSIKVDHNAVMGSVNSLTADGYVVTTPVSAEFWDLMPEALGYLESGSPEKQVFGAVLAAGVGGADEPYLKSKLGDELVKIGVGKCMARKWIARDKASGRYSPLVEGVEVDELVDQLRHVAAGKADS